MGDGLVLNEGMTTNATTTLDMTAMTAAELADIAADRAASLTWRIAAYREMERRDTAAAPATPADRFANDRLVVDAVIVFDRPSAPSWAGAADRYAGRFVRIEVDPTLAQGGPVFGRLDGSVRHNPFSRDTFAVNIGGCDRLIGCDTVTRMTVYREVVA